MENARGYHNEALSTHSLECFHANINGEEACTIVYNIWTHHQIDPREDVDGPDSVMRINNGAYKYSFFNNPFGMLYLVVFYIKIALYGCLTIKH